MTSQKVPALDHYVRLVELGAKLIPAKEGSDGKAPLEGRSWWRNEVRLRTVKSKQNRHARYLLVPASLGLWALDADNVINKETLETVLDYVPVDDLAEIIGAFPPGAFSPTTKGYHLFWLVEGLAEHFEGHRRTKRKRPKSPACQHERHKNVGGAIWAGCGRKDGSTVKYDVRCCNGYLRLPTANGADSIINCVEEGLFVEELPNVVDVKDLRAEIRAKEIARSRAEKDAKGASGRKRGTRARYRGRSQRHEENLTEYAATTQNRHDALLRLAGSSAAFGVPFEDVVRDFGRLVEAKLGEPGFDETRVEDERDRVLYEAAQWGAQRHAEYIESRHGTTRRRRRKKSRR